MPPPLSAFARSLQSFLLSLFPDANGDELHFALIGLRILSVSETAPLLRRIRLFSAPERSAGSGLAIKLTIVTNFDVLSLLDCEF